MAEPVLSQQQRAALDSLQAAIIACEADAAKEAATRVVAADVDPAYALENANGAAAKEVGEKFDSGEYFLPHLVMAGDAMTEAGAVLEASIPKDQIQSKKVVVIGTVEADMHSVGKNIVAMMLKSGGFEVHDLGVDVKSSAFLAKAREVKADIIALSSLLTTTMPYIREVVEDLTVSGLRERFKVMVGGGPVTQEFAEKIGADGYGRDAAEAVRVARNLVEV
ncbi:MAG: corrinoid protein [Actinobacteria bacterium]|nr:corrinoid protein [Actinomycetota bacterium]